MIPTMVWLLVVSSPLALFAQSQKPVVASPVLNGASLREFPSDNFAVPALAPGSIFTVFGSGLGPQELVHGALPYPTQLPVDPGGTRVVFRSLANGQTFDAYLIHSWQSQVSGIIPSQVPVGPAEAVVFYGGKESDAVATQIVEMSPALFTVSQNGMGPAVIQNYESGALQPLNSLTRPARPGQYLILWGTGLGAIQGPDNIPPPVGNVRKDLVVRIGGVLVEAEYAGRAPGFPGLDQINVRIPEEDISLNCYVDMAVDPTSDFGLVTVAISDEPDRCAHPWGIGLEQLQRLDQGGTITFSGLNIGTHLGSESAYLRLAEADAYGVYNNLAQGRSLVYLGSPGPTTCVPGISFRQPPWQGKASTTIASSLSGRRAILTGLSWADGPAEIPVVGPGGRTVHFQSSEPDTWFYTPNEDISDDFFQSGTWTVRYPASGSFPAVETNFWIPPLPEFDLPEIISPNQDIVLEWDPSPYRAGDRIVFSLAALNPVAGKPGYFEGPSLRCIAEGLDGGVTLRAAGLEQLQIGSGVTMEWEISVEPELKIVREPPIDFGYLGVVVGLAAPAQPE